MSVDSIYNKVIDFAYENDSPSIIYLLIELNKITLNDAIILAMEKQKEEIFSDLLKNVSCFDDKNILLQEALNFESRDYITLVLESLCE